MQAGTTSPRPRVRFSDIASTLGVLVGVALLVLLFLSFVLERRPTTPPGAALPPATGRIAYFEFGIAADTLWLVSAADPSQRERAFSVPHAREFGVVPSVSPDGKRIAFAALPAENLAPTPDAPAGLWLADVARGAEARLLVAGVDLRLPPVWTPDGANLVYRRSDASGYVLASLPVAGGAERVLARSDGAAALFAAGFSPDAARFYHVRLSQDGSLLYAVDMASGAETEVGVLSAGLTRDWHLSPDGSRLAFLEMAFSAGVTSSQAFIFDIATATLQPVTGGGVSAFGPVWNAQGELVVGSLSADGESAIIHAGSGTTSHVPGPARGFDVPLASSPDGATQLVRAFSGESATAPGAATLTLIDSNGERHVIARGDVTFAGWSTP